MKESTFKKLVGDNFEYTSNGEYEFKGNLVMVMDKVRAWDNLCFSAVRVINGIQFHLVLARNANFFKTDGQHLCLQLFIMNEETNQCYLSGCRTFYLEKDIKDAVKYYLHCIDNYNTSKFEENFNDKAKSYPWQTSIKN